MGMYGSLSIEAYGRIQQIKADIKYYSSIQNGALYVSRDILGHDYGVHGYIYSIAFYNDNRAYLKSTIGLDTKDSVGYTTRRVIKYFERHKVFVPVKYDEETEVQMALGTFPENYLITHRIDRSKIK